MKKQLNFYLKSKQNIQKQKISIHLLYKNIFAQKNGQKWEKNLFSLQTRSTDVKTNYKNKYKLNMQCSLCEIPCEDESEINLLKCTKILENIGNDTDVTNIQNAKYENIFSKNIDDQVSITKIFAKVFKTKNILLTKLWFNLNKNLFIPTL